MASDDKNEALLDLILRIFRVFNGFSGPTSDELFWRTDGEYAPVKIFVLCNDLFYWACSDLEEITQENIELLESTAAELKELAGDSAECGSLFCCRVRKMRPQKPAYEYIPEKLRPLFDACGPERTD